MDFSQTNVVDRLRHYRETQPDQSAMEDGERKISYAELDRRTDEAAFNIRTAGIRPGTIVTVVLADSIEHLIVICGLARAGAVIFALPKYSPAKEIVAAMGKIGSHHVITDTGSENLQAYTVLPLSEICQQNGNRFEKPGAAGDDPLALIQSSGTTGEPKSFFGTHATALHQSERALEGEIWNPNIRYVNTSAMSFHVCRGFLYCLLRFGATFVLSRATTGKGLANLIIEKNVNYVRLLRPDLMALLAYAGKKEVIFPNLQLMGISSAPTSHEHRLMARKRLTPNFREYYGTNEGGTFFVATPDDQDTFPDSVGRLYNGVETQIVDQHHKSLPAGEAGFIRMRGLGVVRQYIDNPEMTARHFRDDWYYPGDVGKLNDQGYLFFLGRADDTINNAGIKFFPIEVETVLQNHPAVKEAAVFPWPHHIAGQVAAAGIITDGEVTAAELQRFCGEHLANYKIPMHFVVAKQFPRNALGKVLKYKLAETIRAAEQQQSKG